MTTKTTLGVVDPEVIDRANHTGEQPISSVTNLQTELDDLQPISGTWSPTLTNVANVDSSSSGGNLFFRVGDMVHCVGFIVIDPTSASDTATRVDMSLPIASDFTSSGDGRGVFSTQLAHRSGAIFAQTTSDLVRFEFSAEVTTSLTFSYSFSYVVK